MRKTMLFLAVLGLATSLLAADHPALGSWKLNVAKSKVPAAMVENVKEATMIVREADADTFEFTSTTALKNGSTSITKFTVPKSGGNQTYQQGAPGQGKITVVTVMLDPSDSYNTYLQNGKQVSLMHVVISKDGKSYTASQQGTDAQGKPTQTTTVWDKQ